MRLPIVGHVVPTPGPGERWLVRGDAVLPAGRAVAAFVHATRSGCIPQAVHQGSERTLAPSVAFGAIVQDFFRFADERGLARGRRAFEEYVRVASERLTECA